MTQAELNALVNSLIIDNNTNQVTPAKVRSVFLAVIDSIQQTNLNAITATSPLNYDAFLNIFTILQSSGSTNGYLSSSDWAVFNAKQELLVSGTNIKTINGTSLLGSGNISIAVDVLGTVLAGLTAAAGTFTAASTVLEAFGKIKYLIDNIATTYQVILVSGTNIKTVNGVSLLGSGNLTTNGYLKYHKNVNISVSDITGTTSESLLTSFLAIPSSVGVSVNDRIEIEFDAVKNATSGTYTPVAYFGTALNGMTNKVLTGQLITTNVFSKHIRSYSVVSSTSVYCLLPTLSAIVDVGQFTSLGVNSTVPNLTNDVYITFTVTNSSVSLSSNIKSVSIKIYGN